MFSEGHYQHVAESYPDLVRLIAPKRIIFVDSITDLTRQAMAWAKTRPEAFSDKTGKPDVRGAYGLLAREVIALLKHLQHAPGKTVIFVGILECVVDEFNRERWQPQMEGGKAGRELPGIVDQVISMSLFVEDGEGWRHEPAKGPARRLVCRSGNPYGLPAKDRSGNLNVTEPPVGLKAAELLAESDQCRGTACLDPLRRDAGDDMYDLLLRDVADRGPPDSRDRGRMAAGATATRTAASHGRTRARHTPGARLPRRDVAASSDARR